MLKLALSFFHQILAITFMWQLVTYHSKGYQVVCLLIICFKENANLPSQGVAYFVIL
jgi:hypothetical protein